MLFLTVISSKIRKVIVPTVQQDARALVVVVVGLYPVSGRNHRIVILLNVAVLIQSNVVLVSHQQLLQLLHLQLIQLILSLWILLLVKLVILVKDVLLVLIITIS